MLGGAGVGKTALTQQFLTSEYMAAQNTSFDDSIEYTIPVMLDGQDLIVDLIDLPYSGADAWTSYEVDAYIVVYSITDRRSFRKAVEFLTEITASAPKGSNCVILVANKTDLERSRVINRQEGKSVAELHNAKYTEVSAILNHKVDDLLVGVLKRILHAPLRQASPQGPPQTPSQPVPQRRGSRTELIDRQDSGTAACCGSKGGGRKSLSLRKMFMKSGVLQGLFKSKSCENLFNP
ncbi:hypothetical protein CAPTEDRAFT_141741 [Capitella teleta]|uniref:Small monomeric GTPase n=1 Tax=Capitella teleta TaxID=283909 RepID=R7V1M1_CAPTE|nr:hypothetical protein CAPTEDRAFT_141741 [Capitella teleta]|eukprot:ELU10211.1 hypothetical protein CAPTEDRAFT_141741 [Capitella teleta]